MFKVDWPLGLNWSGGFLKKIKEMQNYEKIFIGIVIVLVTIISMSCTWIFNY